MSNIANAPRYAPGKSSPFVNLNPQTIVSHRAPLGSDHAEISTMWIEGTDTANAQVNAIWINTGSNAGSTVWTNIANGNGSFNNLSVNNLLLPYTNATQGRIEFGGIATVIVPEITSIFVGQASGNVTYTGNHNSALGELTLSSLTTGHDNVAIGYDAGSNVTTGLNNVLVGSLAGTALTTGHDNVVLGKGALVASTTSISNIAIGTGALAGVTTGTGQNIAIGGNGVLAGITTGATNIAIGYGAGSALVTGTEHGNIYLNDAGVNAESNVMRLTSNGAAYITTSIAAALSLNTTGTGTVLIGNTTGNVGITGNTTITTGNLVLATAATYISMPGPVFIYSGAGAPANGLALHVGDMYINTTAASATTRLYIATAASTWTNVTCAG